MEQHPVIVDDRWIDGIDVSEHHCIDFDAVRRLGVQVAIVRAGRGTRQDSRWIEHTRSAQHAGLLVGSYWHVYPSHTAAHHQAELWNAAIRNVPHALTAGHWADITAADGFDAFELGRYVASFLRRMDELLGRTVGVFTSDMFWRRHVRFDITGRPRWIEQPVGSADEIESAEVFAIRTRAADRGGPGAHRIHGGPFGPPARRLAGLYLVPRGPDESVARWQARWIRTPDVAVLQERLNLLGADLFVDGVYGPATDAAVRTCRLLRRRDRLDVPDQSNGYVSFPVPDVAIPS